LARLLLAVQTQKKHRKKKPMMRLKAAIKNHNNRHLLKKLKAKILSSFKVCHNNLLMEGIKSKKTILC